MANFFHFLRKNSFVLLLLAAFVLSDVLISYWDPMVTSRRFYKNDFTKTVYHHEGATSGPVFFGNSAVTGAYIEEKSSSKLIEMGLSYGKLTDLKAILEQGRFHVQQQLVIGIDVHTMLDIMETDPTYPWFKTWYDPYVYKYGSYFIDSGTEVAKQLARGLVELNPAVMKAYEPRWIDKMLYFGHMEPETMNKKEKDYDQKYGWAKLPQYINNLEALDWIIRYTESQNLPLRVVWMPWNRNFEQPRYMPELKKTVDARLKAAGVPTLDLLSAYDPKYFHDLVHLNREEGAPVFTKEVDAWLASLAASSKS
jgi:hypothetical protein